ncbi:MAG TPA: methyltransferase domain-containing protein [bacterium]|nr:methyltransferase domain-containing protein [bacterium]
MNTGCDAGSGIYVAADARFDRGADRYAAYLATSAGRLRLELAFANLLDFLPRAAAVQLRALDLGGGTGEIAVRLARRGVHVTLLDRSPKMLEIADRAARQAGVSDDIVMTLGDVAASSSLFPEGSFDIIVCHHVLEYTPHPAEVLSAAAHVMRRNATATLSVVARNQAGAVVKAAIQSGDLATVERLLADATGDEALFGGRVRLFTPAELRTMLREASFEPVAERGIRVLFDYLAPPIVCEAGEGRIVALERALGARAEFSALARYTQVLARRRPTPRALPEGGQ